MSDGEDVKSRGFVTPMSGTINGQPVRAGDKIGVTADGEVRITPPKEIVRTTEGGAMRADVGKVPLHLVPPEVMKLALPERYHGFIDWFHGNGSIEDLRMCAIFAHGSVDAARGVFDVARVWEKGAKKYAAWNWFKGLLFSNLYNSAMRHALKAQYEDIDSVADGGTGEPHEAHYTWNVVVCYVFAVQGRTELDDRTVCAQPQRAA